MISPAEREKILHRLFKVMSKLDDMSRARAIVWMIGRYGGSPDINECVARLVKQAEGGRDPKEH